MKEDLIDSLARQLEHRNSRRTSIRLLATGLTSAISLSGAHRASAEIQLGGECVPGEPCDRFGHCIEGYCIKASQDCWNAALGLLEDGFTFNAIWKKMSQSRCGYAVQETFFHFFSDSCSEGQVLDGAQVCIGLAKPKKEKKKKK